MAYRTNRRQLNQLHVCLLSLIPALLIGPLAVAKPPLMGGFPPPPDRRVTAANWMSPPYNRWALQHLETLTPSVTVDRGNGPISPLRMRKEDLHRHRFTAADGTERELSQYLREQGVDALLFYRNGHLRFEVYRHKQTPRTRHQMMSVTKSFTGLLAEMLIHDGTIDESAQITAYLPELSGSAYQGATVRNLLDMEIGIQFAEVYTDPDSDISQFIYAAGLLQAPTGSRHYDSLYSYLPTLRPAGLHGQDFHYVTANSEVLGWLLSRVTNTPFEHLFQDRLFQPVGPERDAYFVTDRAGKAIAGGGLNITARDLLRLGILLNQDGRLKGRQIIPKAVLAKIRAGGVPRPGLWGNETGGRDHSYRSQWYIHHPSGTISATGIHGQHLYIAPAADAVLVVQSSHPQADGAYMNVTDALFQSLIRR